MATGLYTGLSEITRLQSQTGVVQQQQSAGDLVYGHVLDVILDYNSEYYTDASSIGCIRYKNLHNMGSDEALVDNIAHPLDRSNYTLPLPGEQVIIIKAFGSNVNGVYTGRSYYTNVVSTKDVVNDNVVPYLGGTGANNSVLGTIKELIGSDADNISAQRFENKTIHNQGRLKDKQILEKPREGDRIIEGRYGGVIKFTSTILKDKSQRSVFPTAGSVDGDPLLIIKNNRKAAVDGITYVDDELNKDDVGIYLTTSQKLPLVLGCSKNLHTWNPDKVAGIQATKAAIDALNKQIDVNYKIVPIDVIDLTVNQMSPVDVQNLGGRDRFAAVTKLVINLLEGGYYNPIWHNTGDARYGASGETLYGIDRVAGGAINKTVAGRKFWDTVDKNKTQNVWRWNYMPSDPLKTQLQELAVDIMFAVFNSNIENYGTQTLVDAINSDERLLFNFVYASWNGPGFFQGWAKKVSDYIEKSNPTKDQILNYALNLRTDSGISLIVQGGNKIKGFINQIFKKSEA